MDSRGMEAGCDIGRIISDFFASEILKAAIDAVTVQAAQLTNALTLQVEADLKDNEQGSAESSEKLEYRIAQVNKQKETVLEAFFRHEVTKDEMRWMNDKYDQELEELKTKLQAAREYSGLVYDTTMLRKDIQQYMKQICQTTEWDEPFLKNILGQMTIFHDYRIELRMNLIPQKWRFILDSLYDIRSRLQAENVVIPTVSDTVVHYDSSVSTKQQVEKSLDLQGFEASVFHFNPYVPISVSNPFNSGVGME